jgi:uncharacterized iron-regulated membrane protein
MALSVLSGVVISFPWARTLAYRAVGDEHPAGSASSETPPGLVTADPSFDLARLDAVGGRALGRTEGWRRIQLAIPRQGEPAMEIRVEEGRPGQPQKRVQLRYDLATGWEEGRSTFQDQSPGARVRSFLRFAHTGEFFGLPGQTLAGIVSLMGMLLVWTGLALTGRRVVRALAPRRRHPFGVHPEGTPHDEPEPSAPPREAAASQEARPLAGVG